MRLIPTVLVSSALLAAVPAFAADSGAFVGVGVGQASTEVDNLVGTGYKFDEQDTGYKLFGGYKFFPWLAVEGAYMDGGSPSVTLKQGTDSLDIAIDVQALVASAVFTLPLGDQFELFIKPGIAYWDSKTSGRLVQSGTVVGHGSQDDSGSAFFLGGGAAFNFNENLGVRLEYEWFDVAPTWDDYQDEFVQELDASTGFFSASFVYRF